MRIAVLGGSFNPLHNGHVMIARSVCSDLGYDKVLFVPAFIPPHKSIRCNVTAEERLEMVNAFCVAEGNGAFECEPCEIERGGVSYTCDTLEYICQKYGGVLEEKPAFVLGEESAAEFHKWKNPDRIVQLADLVIAGREAGPEKNTNCPVGEFTGDFSVEFDGKRFGYPYVELKNPIMKISSSRIRTMIENGDPWESLVPETIGKIIKDRKFYRELK